METQVDQEPSKLEKFAYSVAIVIAGVLVWFGYPASERIKDAVDPDGIVAAGRGGIWPKELRKG